MSNIRNDSIDLATLRLLVKSGKRKHYYVMKVIELLQEASPDKCLIHYKILRVLNPSNPFRDQVGIKDNRLYPAGDFKGFYDLIGFENPELSFVEIATAYRLLIENTKFNINDPDPTIQRIFINYSKSQLRKLRKDMERECLKMN